MGTTFQVIDQTVYELFNPEFLSVNSPLPADIFLRDKSIIQPIFYKGTLFTESSRAFLKERGITEVFLRREDAALLKQSQHAVIPHEQPDAAWGTYAAQKEEYCQIYKNVLVPGAEIDFSLFIRKDGIFSLLLEAGDESPVILDEKVLKIEHDLLIKKTDMPRYKNYLISLREPDAQGDSTTKAIVIKENSKMVLKSLLEDPRSGEKIKEIEVLVKDMIDTIVDNRNTIYDLISLKNYDYYTYTHSVNVAVLSIGIGAEIGLGKNKIEELAMGGMLHDIGKSAVPITVLNKPGKLTDDEYLLMKKHVSEGTKILKSHQGITEDSFHAAAEHHERLTGTGYPARLSGRAISLFGRITAIADVYDAMTTQRCYQPAYTPFYALTTISRQKEHFDPDLLKVFIRMLGKA